MKAKVAEVFKSIQGEGIYQGKEQVFVRFFGCNLKCDFCDTKLTRYEEKNLSEVLKEIAAFEEYHSVSLTGGEPLIQAAFLKELAKQLKEEGKMVYLETNGTLHRNLAKVINYVDIIAMDFKLPSAAKTEELWREHNDFLAIALKKEVFIKAVITLDTELIDLSHSLSLIKGLKPDVCFVLQPQHPFEDLLKKKMQDFREICFNKSINVRIIPQLHKKSGVK